MSVSMHFQILRDPEHELFKKHMAVNQACLDAGIKKLPEETAAYFNCEYPECASEMERRALEIEFCIEITVISYSVFAIH